MSADRRNETGGTTPTIGSWPGSDPAMRTGRQPPPHGITWEQSGLTPHEAAAWVREGFSPAATLWWKDAGYVPRDAHDWADTGFAPAHARRWDAAAFRPQDEARWRDSGWDPDDASTWAADGFSAATAVDWIDAGYAPRAAQAWRADGVESPQLARQWADQGFIAESAGMWTSIQGITPSDAIIAVNAGKASTDLSRVQRADPDWIVPPDPEVAAPDMGPWM